MEIDFRSDKERCLYSSYEALVRKYNKDMAHKIIQRIGELVAAAGPLCLTQSARFHEHKGQRRGLFSLDLIHPYRLIIKPVRDYSDYREIDSVIIWEVFNPHK